MVNKSTLVLIPSPIYDVLGEKVFNIHVSDTSEVNIYKFADVVYPYFECSNSKGFLDGEIADIIEFCKSLESELVNTAQSLEPSSDTFIPDDIMRLVRRNLG